MSYIQNKTVNEKSFHQFEWAGFLNGATISTSTWTLETGITKVTDAISGTKTNVSISGGSEGGVYTVTCKIVASDGREETQDFVLWVVRMSTFTVH